MLLQEGSAVSKTMTQSCNGIGLASSLKTLWQREMSTVPDDANEYNFLAKSSHFRCTDGVGNAPKCALTRCADATCQSCRKDASSVNIYARGESFETGPNSYSVRGYGSDIWFTRDECHFLYFPMHGDVTLTVKVKSFNGAESWSKGGIMLRDSLASDSAHFSIVTSGNTKIATQWRSTTANESRAETSEALGTHDVELKLVKVGGVLRAFYRSDQSNGWIKQGPTKCFKTTGEFYLGLAVTSHDIFNPATMRVTDLELSPNAAVGMRSDMCERGDILGSGGAASSVHIGAGPEGTFFETGQDSWIVKGFGNDIYGNSDSFEYIYFKMSGDTTTTVKIESFEGEYLNGSKGGIMLRHSLEPDSAHLSILTIAGASGARVEKHWRGFDGAETQTSGAACYGNAVEYKIQKIGIGISAFCRRDQSDMWTEIESEVKVYSFELEYFVGIAVSSYSSEELATLKLSQFKSGPYSIADQWKKFEKSCVNGANGLRIEYDTAQVPNYKEECMRECGYDSTCKGVEIYHYYGGSSNFAKEGSCQFSTSANTEGCNGATYNLDFYAPL